MSVFLPFSHLKRLVLTMLGGANQNADVETTAQI